MTMPSIADVKAAIERLNAADDFVKRPLKEQQAQANADVMSLFRSHISDNRLIQDFAKAILSAPGMSVERLEEIQGFVKTNCLDGVITFESMIEELLAEVLRLRAQLESPPVLKATNEEAIRQLNEALVGSRPVIIEPPRPQEPKKWPNLATQIFETLRPLLGIKEEAFSRFVLEVDIREGIKYTVTKPVDVRRAQQPQQ